MKRYVKSSIDDSSYEYQINQFSATDEFVGIPEVFSSFSKALAYIDNNPLTGGGYYIVEKAYFGEHGYEYSEMVTDKLTGK